MARSDCAYATDRRYCIYILGYLKSIMTRQIITRDGVVICVTTVPYPDWIIKDMKRAGYKIKTEETEDERES